MAEYPFDLLGLSVWVKTAWLVSARQVQRSYLAEYWAKLAATSLIEVGLLAARDQRPKETRAEIVRACFSKKCCTI